MTQQVETLVHVLDEILACETKYDERGHAYLKIPARSLNDLGAAIAFYRKQSADLLSSLPPVRAEQPPKPEEWANGPYANSPSRFDCQECRMRGIAVDEDGCCRTCGHDAERVGLCKTLHVPPVRETTPERPAVEPPATRVDERTAKQCGARSLDGNCACDREPGHDGDHRGYCAQIDEPMFWPQMPPNYSKVEQDCRGCMGPCGRCAELEVTPPPSAARVQALEKVWREKSAEWWRQAEERGDLDDITTNRFRARASQLAACADELSAALEGAATKGESK